MSRFIRQSIAGVPQYLGATDPVLQHVYAVATQIHNALIAAGIKEPAASYATYQTYYETAAYSNNGAKQWNNYSGIKYNGQKGAKKAANGYADFTTFNDWMASFVHEITKGTNPAGAATIEDYVSRLKANRYFEDTEPNYLNGLKRARLVLKIMPDADNAVGPGAGTPGWMQKMEDFFKQHPWEAAAGSVLALLVVKKILD